MKNTKEFPFSRARRIKEEGVKKYRAAIGKKLGEKRSARPGRPPKALEEKYKPVSLRLHPKVYEWVKKQAKKRHIAYQSLINEILLKEAA